MEEVRPRPRRPRHDGFVVFASGDGLFSMAPDGSEQRRLTFAAQEPAFSPDGRTIAFVDTSAGPQRLAIMGFDGSNPQALNLGLDGIIHPTWSPDGRRIAFSASPDFAGWNVHVVDCDGSNLVRITDVWGVGPTWSPDGAWIAFASLEGGIDVVRPNGSDRHRLTPPDPGIQQYPLWSRDGERLVYSRLPPDWRTNALYTQHLYTVRPDGTGTQQLTEGQFVDFANTFSPDGSKLLITRVPDPFNPSWTLHLLNAEGTDADGPLPDTFGTGATWAAPFVGGRRPELPEIVTSLGFATRPTVPPR